MNQAAKARLDIAAALYVIVRSGEDPAETREWILRTLRGAVERTAPWEDDDMTPIRNILEDRPITVDTSEVVTSVGRRRSRVVRKR